MNLTGEIVKYCCAFKGAQYIQITCGAHQGSRLSGANTTSVLVIERYDGSADNVIKSLICPKTEL